MFTDKSEAETEPAIEVEIKEEVKEDVSSEDPQLLQGNESTEEAADVERTRSPSPPRPRCSSMLIYSFSGNIIYCFYCFLGTQKKKESAKQKKMKKEATDRG